MNGEELIPRILSSLECSFKWNAKNTLKAVRWKAVKVPSPVLGTLVTNLIRKRPVVTVTCTKSALT
jgi:hypothetical protein